MGTVGKLANRQILVSLTLASTEAPACVALRLFLWPEWTGDPARCRAMGVPEENLAPRTKLDRARETGVTFDRVLAEEAYGTSAALRQALSARGLT